MPETEFQTEMERVLFYENQELRKTHIRLLKKCDSLEQDLRVMQEKWRIKSMRPIERIVMPPESLL